MARISSPRHKERRRPSRRSSARRRSGGRSPHHSARRRLVRGKAIAGGWFSGGLRATGTAATRACGKGGSPRGRIAVAVKGNGDCLYNSFGHLVYKLARSRHAHFHATKWYRMWKPGKDPANRIGNMRDVLLQFMQSDEVPSGVLTRGTVRRVKERVNKEREKGWGHYQEVALLAAMFRVCADIYSSYDDKDPHALTVANASGRTVQYYSKHMVTGACTDSSGAPRPRVAILNTNRQHFEPLVACSSGASY